MSEPLPVGFPVPSPKDPEQVARALEVAAERWKEGSFTDALAEVERAAAAASSVDANEEPMVSSKRVVALALAANDLAAYVRKRALATLRSAEPIAIDLLAVPSSSDPNPAMPFAVSGSSPSIDLTSQDVESLGPSSVPTPRVVTPNVLRTPVVAGPIPGPSPFKTTLSSGSAAASPKMPPASDPPSSFVGVTPKSDFTKTLRSGATHLDQPRRSFTPARFNAVNVRAAVGDGTPLAVFFDAPVTRRADEGPPSEASPSQPATRRPEGVYPPVDLGLEEIDGEKPDDKK